ncbi:solute-binding protein [Sphaerisporangium siamense]|uniref:Multiple sugar transport system substrate-binding protein n=1 Tax=Sphaerisporangium siamense TaxID=795645 RepID=A0A7W7D1W0_9ACTN|nr:extracellular solute-binding protein [Sphaerisporangium siamense]MBB4698747.1 multiple sugar transport system substrate-binding protein [Sphaerisporangium siamense]GII85192.1 solute-binding protein [Sphaerisporangium siamense]
MKRTVKKPGVPLLAGVAASLLLTACGGGGSTGESSALTQEKCDALVSKEAAPTAAAAPSSPAEPAPSATSGGGSGTPAAGGKKEITFVAGSYTSTTAAFWKDLIGKFEGANPGFKVKLQIVDWNNIDQQVATLIQTKQYPDILNQNKFSGWAANGILQPAADLVSPEVQNDFIPAFKNASVYEGVQYGLPFITSTRALFYNKDAFAKANITAPPTTWRELVDAAKKLQAAGYTGFGLPLGSEESQAEWSIWQWGNGGDWESAPGKFTINSSNNVNTLNFLNCMTNVYKVTQANAGQTNRTDGVFRPFADGKVGMMSGASFAPALFKQWNSTVNYGVAPLPVNGDVPPFTLGVQDYLMSFKNPGNTESVSKFLNFVYQPDNYQRFLTSQGFLPATQSASTALADNADFAPFLKLLPTARFYPATDPKFPLVQGAIQNQIGTGIAPGADAKKILDAINAAGK